MSEIIKFNYNLELLSLEYMAIVRIATMLWDQCDIKDLMSKFSFSFPITRDIREEWLKIEDRVAEKVSLLLIPEHLKPKVSDFTETVGTEIFKWIRYHGKPYLGIGLPQEFCWTSHGTIDRQKTAEFLVKDDNLDITVRYKLACIYCLENKVQELWTNMHVDCRKCFGDALVYHHKIVEFWTCLMQGELDKYQPLLLNLRRGRINSPYKNAFDSSVIKGDTVAAEYFFQKLTPTEKNKSLEECSYYVAAKVLSNSILEEKYYSESLCFLLSKMNGVQQKEFFEKYYYCGLGLIAWPWQRYFMKAAVLVFNFIGLEYYTILENIILKIREGHAYFDYREMFIEFWQQSPDFLKTSDLRALSKILSVLLFEFQDKSFFKLIFKDISPRHKDDILFLHEGGLAICRRLIQERDWDLLEYFLRECIISANRLTDFKKCFQSEYDELKRFVLEMNNYMFVVETLNYVANADLLLPIFYHLLEDILCEFDERKGNEETDTSHA